MPFFSYKVGSTPDYSVCLGYLTNYTNSINTATLTVI